MERIIYISILVTSLVCITGCDSGERINGQYELVNSTNHQIIISSYAKSDLSGAIQNLIELPESGDSWLSCIVNLSAGSVWPGRPEIFDGDSLTIIFDNIKIISVADVDDTPDLFGGDAYEILNAGNKRIYRYTFTESDYENAEFIE
jgi:hypothetical protein